MDFCSALLYGLPNIDLHGLLKIMNSAVKSNVYMPRCSTVRNSAKANEVHFSSAKVRIEVKISLLAYKPLLSGEPEYIKKLL